MQTECLYDLVVELWITRHECGALAVVGTLRPALDVSARSAAGLLRRDLRRLRGPTGAQRGGRGGCAGSGDWPRAGDTRRAPRLCDGLRGNVLGGHEPG